MASKGNTFENQLLLHVFNNANIALIGDATGLLAAGTVGSLYVSLHYANPDETGDQTTSEMDYTGTPNYTRQAVARATGAGGWNVSGNAVNIVSEVAFSEKTGGTDRTVTHFAVGTAASGAGKILYWGLCAPNIAVTNGVTPRFAATTGLIITED